MVLRTYDINTDQTGEAQFSGLRLTADEFFELPEDGHRYELVDGVVVMSPSPKPPHQDAVLEIAYQIKAFLRRARVGKVFVEIDVYLGQRRDGSDLVYRPDLCFVRTERLASMRERIVGAPDLVVEAISRGSRRLDTVTKREDYERFGVREYWILDPARESTTFLGHDGSGLAEVRVAPNAETFASQAIPGFSLDLVAVRGAFEAW